MSIRCWYPLVVVALFACKSEPRAERTAERSATDTVATVNRELIGAWIQMFPDSGALDTLWLKPNGRIAGSTAGFDKLDFVSSEWHNADSSFPQGFCHGEGHRHSVDRYACMGWLISGDTLWLANQKHSAFLRASAITSPGSLRPWTYSRGAPVAPSPAQAGAGVKIGWKPKD